MEYITTCSRFDIHNILGAWAALALAAIGMNNLLEERWSPKYKSFPNYMNIAITLLVVVYFLSVKWLPLGAHNSLMTNYLFVICLVALILTLLMLMVNYYEQIIRWCLANKWKFLLVPAVTLFLGLLCWQGSDKIIGFTATGLERVGWKSIRQTSFWQTVVKTFLGLVKSLCPHSMKGHFF